MLLIIAVASYLIGAVPIAYLVARSRGVDIFGTGSGNMGATNVARVIGFGWGFTVYVLDGLKGVAAILLAQQLLPDDPHAATVVAAIMSIVGHNWSLFVMMLRGELRGGKGASTAYGTLVVILPLYAVVIVSAVGAYLIYSTRYVSLGALTLFGMAALWILALVAQGTLAEVYTVYAALLLAMLLLRFRGNIRRLLDGTERRLGEKVEAETA